MEFKFGSVIEPLPTDEYISNEEKSWRITLPKAYRDFIKKYSGGIPNKRRFISCGREYYIDRFLCMLSEYRTHKLGMYDIGVVLTQIEDRLSDNPDLIGAELLPIAVLFAGDFICLDFKKNIPGICVWSHEESRTDKPVTYPVADSFEAFLPMLY